MSDAKYDERLGWIHKKEGIGNGITEPKKGLTPKQIKFLEEIQVFTKANGYPPSYEELKQLLGLKSKSSVHRYIHTLKFLISVGLRLLIFGVFSRTYALIWEAYAY